MTKIKVWVEQYGDWWLLKSQFEGERTEIKTVINSVKHAKQIIKALTKVVENDDN